MCSNRLFFQLLLQLCLAISCLPYLQAQIKGTVLDDTSAPLAFVNVLLLHPSDSSLVAGALTDDAGQFQLDTKSSGEYLLGLRAIGYQSWYSTPFNWSGDDGLKDFGAIQLSAGAIELEGLEVRATKSLFQQQMEGTVINVQSSVMNRGNSVLQVLERSPGVFIDQRNANISLNGQSGVQVMINGKLLRLPPAEVIGMLNGMSADNIDKIELLTTPSARYDVDGSAGMINIVLKKNTAQGTNGSMSMSGGHGWGPKAAGSLNFNHRRNQLNIHGSYAYAYDDTFYDFSAIGSEIVPVLGGNVDFDFSNKTDQLIRSHNATLGLENSFANDLTIGGSLSWQGSRNESTIENLTQYDIEPDSFLRAEIGINTDNRWQNTIASLFIEKKLGKSGQLNINTDYLYYHNENPSQALSLFFDRKDQQVFPEGSIYANDIRGSNNTNMHIGVVQVDYTQDVRSWLRLETGLKGTYSETTNIGQLERREGENWVPDTRTTTTIDVREKIGAAYALLQMQFDPKTSMNLGVRYAFWDQEFSAANLDRRLGQFFPSIFLSRELSPDNQLRLAYTKRITRPDYNDLASYLVYNGPISVFTGNSQLQPTITNTLKLSWQHQVYNFAIQLQEETLPIARYQIVENSNSNLVIVAPQNVNYQRSLNFQTNIPVTLNKWWSVNLGGMMGWRQFEVSYTQVPKKHTYFAGNLYGNQTITLPGGWSFEVSGWYNTGHYNGSVRLEGFGMLNAGLKKQLSGDRGSFQLTLTDILRSMEVISYYGDLTKEAFNAVSRVHYHAESANARILRLSYFRSFGNRKLKKSKQRQSGASEERSRVRQ